MEGLHMRDGLVAREAMHYAVEGLLDGGDCTVARLLAALGVRFEPTDHTRVVPGSMRGLLLALEEPTCENCEDPEGGDFLCGNCGHFEFDGAADAHCPACGARIAGNADEG